MPLQSLRLPRNHEASDVRARVVPVFFSRFAYSRLSCEFFSLVTSRFALERRNERNTGRQKKERKNDRKKKREKENQKTHNVGTLR